MIFECTDALLTHRADPTRANGRGTTPAAALLNLPETTLPADKTMQRLMESGMGATPEMVAQVLWHSNAEMAITAATVGWPADGHVQKATAVTFERFDVHLHVDNMMDAGSITGIFRARAVKCFMPWQF